MPKTHSNPEATENDQGPPRVAKKPRKLERSDEGESREYKRTFKRAAAQLQAALAALTDDIDGSEGCYGCHALMHAENAVRLLEERP